MVRFLLSLLLLATAIGCDARNPAGLDPVAKDDSAAAGAGEPRPGLQQVEKSTSPNDGDDSAQKSREAIRAKNPLIHGLQGLLGSTIDEETGKELRGSLEVADQELSRVRAENRAAIREASRQQRVRGDESPTVVLVLAEGLGRWMLRCYGAEQSSLPRIDRLAAKAACFTNFRAEGTASVYYGLMTGRRGDASGKAGGRNSLLLQDDLNLTKILWQGGYGTALVGDCSLGGIVSPGEAAQQGFDEWFGLRDRRATENVWPEYVWSNGASLRVVPNANGKKGRSLYEILAREVRASLQRQRPRPLFLLVAWPSSNDRPAASGPAGFDSIDELMGEIVDSATNRGGTADAIVVILGTAPDEQKRVPLLIWSGKRQLRPGVRDVGCSAADLLPTLAEVTGTRRRPAKIEGVSLLPVLRQESIAPRQRGS